MAGSSSSPNPCETTLPLATILHMLTIKLSSSNFLLWRNQMLPLLSSQSLLGYVDGSVKPPATNISGATDGSSSSNPEFKTWQFNDQRVLLLLHSSLSEEAMAEVLGLQTARDVWLALEAAYSHDSVERMHTLKDSLRALTKGNSTVSEFGRKFKAICDQLAAIGRPVDEDDKTHWFLCGLGASFENFSTAIMATKPRPTLRALLAQAESHEIFLKSIHGTVSSVPPAAFAAYNVPSYYPRTSGRTSSQQRGGSSGNRGGRGRGRRPPHCQLCRTDGHYADKCPDFERIPRERGKPLSNAAYLAQAFQANCNLETTGAPLASDWYVDSGASAHMTPSASNLDSFTPYDQVQIGNGKCLPISHTVILYYLHVLLYWMY